MEAANLSVQLADPSGSKRSLGIRVDLPFEPEVNAFVNEAFEHRTFFTRLHHFVLVSDAFVVVPGGIGTVLEAIMANSVKSKTAILNINGGTTARTHVRRQLD
jgi:predicted Rossmann-fold nucleotide-binding protein